MGYDLTRFIKDVDEELICLICAMVLENGFQSQHCEHKYCEKCIKEWITINKSCPFDRRELCLEDIRPVESAVRNQLLELEIKCDFEPNGCQTVLRVKNLETHSITCEFNSNEKIMCDKECRLELTRNEYRNHNCLTKLSNILISQQNRITELEKEATNYRKLWVSPNGLTVIQNTIVLREESKLRYWSDTATEYIRFAQSNYPLNEQNPYFEIKVIEFGRKSFLGLFGFSSIDLKEINFEYNASNGTAYVYGDTRTECYDNVVPKWKTGDIIGCGMKFAKQSDAVTLYFTHNGLTVWEYSVKCDKIGVGMYPKFSTNSFGAKIILS